MDKFSVGMKTFHKATDKKCVVLKLEKEKGLVKVRTQDDVERDYYPEELETLTEREQRWNEQASRIPRDNKDWGIG